MTTAQPDLGSLIAHLVQFPDSRSPVHEKAPELASRMFETVRAVSGYGDYYADRNIHTFVRGGSAGFRNSLAVLTWLLEHPYFPQLKPTENSMYELYSAVPHIVVQHDKFVISDWLAPRFAEEFVRTVLDLLHVTPSGESSAQAKARLNELNERPNLGSWRKSSDRELEVRRAMALRAALDAADKFTRE